MRGLRTLIFDVKDLAAAKRFYSEALEQAPYFDQPFYVGFDVGGYELGLRPLEEGQQPAGAGNGTAYLAADDVDATVARLVSLGATVREPPQDVGGGIRTAAVSDPSGNPLGLIANPLFAPPLVAAAADDLSPRSFTHEVTVPASRAEVWKLWTTSEGLTFVVAESKVELRPGGFYEWYFLLDNPPGRRGGEGCRILSFLPERMLSFSWNAPPEQPRTRRQLTWVVVELQDAAGGGTRVALTHLGWPAKGLATDPAWEETYRYFEQAWPRVLAQLATHLSR